MIWINKSKYIVLLFSVLVCVDVVVCGQSIEGKYISKQYGGDEYIVFNSIGNFYFIDKVFPAIRYSDTLSFGKYKREFNVIELNSCYQEVFGSRKSFIDTIIVKEEIIDDSEMKYFIINNEFEDMIISRYDNLNSPLKYQIEIGDDKYFSKNSIVKIPKNKSNSTVFSLTVIVDNSEFIGYCPLSTIFCGFYTVKSDESNYFKITIPQLTVEYMTCMRLYSDYILIKSMDTIIWHGNEYIKE